MIKRQPTGSGGGVNIDDSMRVARLFVAMLLLLQGVNATHSFNNLKLFEYSGSEIYVVNITGATTTTMIRGVGLSRSVLTIQAMSENLVKQKLKYFGSRVRSCRSVVLCHTLSVIGPWGEGDSLLLIEAAAMAM
ncbi:hypothetical protein L208DRAFT_1375968 [Tricholoma matsutake]|nr:hypothetical protein L208DRAFT_1375968 [Tricholoma matsutake 945]